MARQTVSASSISNSAQSGAISTAHQFHALTMKKINDHPQLISKIGHAVALVSLIAFVFIWTLICKIKGLISKFVPETTKQQIRPLIGLPPKSESTLISIRFSHYVEKARWGLDLLTDQIKASNQSSKIYDSLINYKEITTAPITHLFFTLWYTNGKSHSTPAFIKPDNKILTSSSQILHYVSEQLQSLHQDNSQTNNTDALIKSLYPAAGVEELEKYFDDELGPNVRIVRYYHMFNSSDPTVATNLQKSMVAATLPNHWDYCLQSSPIFHQVVRYLLVKKIRINKQRYDESLQRLRNVIERVNSMLSKSYRSSDNQNVFLLNTETITAADITFASLFYPLICPPELGSIASTSLNKEKMGEELYNLVVEFRNSPAGKFALRMYAKHRGRKLVEVRDPRRGVNKTN